MLKPKKIDISQTNIANLGSDLEKNCREAAAGKEPAWTGVGQTTGLNVWRIEKFQVVPWKEEDYGYFYKGDSYIILSTKKVNNKLCHDIFFWLGENTTQDEAGTAAYKTVELDDYLNQEPVQHREVCNYESEAFLALFRKGVHYREGGVESGFRHVKPTEYKPRLIQMKGRRTVKARQVALSCDSLNEGDVFILDLGLTIYQWNGHKSSGVERNKAGQCTRALDDNERMGKAKVIVLDHMGGDKQKDAMDFKDFYGYLGGFTSIKSAAEAPSDTVWEEAKGGEKKLFRISDSNFDLVATGKDVSKDQLKSGDVFILDSGAVIYVWVGSGSSTEERRSSLGFAQSYLDQDDTRPNFLPIVRVHEAGDNRAFNTALNQ